MGFDDRGTAHLILRDDDAFRLVHFRRTAQAGWTSGQTAIKGDSLEEVDNPSLAVDLDSRLVYLFFQTNRFGGEKEVRLSVFSPESGWEGPYRIAPRRSDIDGMLFPSSIGAFRGQPLVLWTRTGERNAIEAARVIAP